MRAFQGDKVMFGGSYTEYLYRTLEIYDSVSLALVLTSSEKMTELIFILKYKALHFFNSKVKQFRTYEDSALLLCRLYNSSDKRSLIITKYPSMLHS